jgi:hypothetical protein
MTGVSPPPGPGEPDPGDPEENRAATNIALAIAFVLLVGGGIWLVGAMLDARRADECMSSGRRNCNPIAVNPPPANPQPLR